MDNSKNAKAAIELIKTQELTKQHEASMKRAEFDAMNKQMELQRVEKEGDEARKVGQLRTRSTVRSTTIKMAKQTNPPPPHTLAPAPRPIDT